MSVPSSRLGIDTVVPWSGTGVCRPDWVAAVQRGAGDEGAAGSCSLADRWGL